LLKVRLIIILFSIACSGYGQLRFIENKGQWPDEVKFRAQLSGASIYLMEDGIRYDLTEAAGFEHGPGDVHEIPEKISHHVIDMSFEKGKKTSVKIYGKKQLPGSYNFFLGSDPSKWGSNASAFEEVVYENAFEQVDIHFYPEGRQLKYDIHLKPGARIADIGFTYKGMDRLRIEGKSLIIENSIQPLVETIPESIHIIEKEAQEINAAYTLEGNTIGFDLPFSKVRRNEEVVIDPILIFSTYSGSFGDNWGYTAAFDEAGNAYSGGIVFSEGFPVTPGAFQQSYDSLVDIGIIKYDSLGREIIYATYLGGSLSESPHSLIVNNQNELIILGSTSSFDYPVSDAAFQSTYGGGDTLFSGFNGLNYSNGSDIIISKLNADGNQLLASTFVGGTRNDGINPSGTALVDNYGDQFRGDVIVDEENFIYVASSSRSGDFPLKNAFQQVKITEDSSDAVIFKFDPDLSELQWSTFFGGLGEDAALSIKLDDTLNVYVAGGTNSTNLPLPIDAFQSVPPAGDNGFAIKLSNDGTQLLGGTYIGASGDDQVFFLDIDPEENIFIMGNNEVVSNPNGNIPIVGNVYSNPESSQFIQKFNNTFSELLLSTTVGSSQGVKDFSPTAFLVNDCGNIYVSGWGCSANNFQPFSGNTNGLPVTANAEQSETDGCDFYLMVLENELQSLLYASFFGEQGGVGDHVDGGTSRFDKRGIVYQAVCASCGASQDFPTTMGVVSEVNNSPNCNNAIFKFDLASLSARFDTNTPDTLNPGIIQGCAPFTFLFINQSIAGQEFLWDFGDGTTSTQADSVLHTYTEAGVYEVVLRAEDVNTCKSVDFARKTIEVFDTDFSVVDDRILCEGESYNLNVSGSGSITWSPSEGLSDTTSFNPVARPQTTTVYSFTATDFNGCIFEDSVRVGVIPQVIADFTVETSYNCVGKNQYRFINLSQNAEQFTWDLGDGTITNEENFTYTYADSAVQNYTVTLTGRTQICTDDKQEIIEDRPTQVPNVITPGDGRFNEFFVIEAVERPRLVITDRWGGKVYESESYQNDWNGSEVSGGVYYYELQFPNGNTCSSWLHVIKAQESTN
jgi:PKD repeat protein